MSQDDVIQIRVGDSPVGIIGLKIVMEDMSEEYGERSDQEDLEELLSRLGKRNYIPEKAKDIKIYLFPLHPAPYALYHDALAANPIHS